MTAAQSVRCERNDNTHTTPTTSSSTAASEDSWTVNMDAALYRYPLKHIFTLPENKQLLLLVHFPDDDSLFSGVGGALDEVKNNGRIMLSDRKYFRLRCHISDAHHNSMVAIGVASRRYLLEAFFRTFNMDATGFKSN